MLSTAFALALLTTGACMLVYNKLPRKARKFIEKHSLLADLAALLAVYALLGGTLTALTAGAMCGIMVSVMLHIANNADDYLYLYDLRDYIKEKLIEVKSALNSYGRIYRSRKLHDTDKVIDAVA